VIGSAGAGTDRSENAFDLIPHINPLGIRIWDLAFGKERTDVVVRVSIFSAITDRWIRFLLSCNDLRAVSLQELLTSGPKKVHSTGWAERGKKTETKDRSKGWPGPETFAIYRHIGGEALKISWSEALKLTRTQFP